MTATPHDLAPVFALLARIFLKEPDPALLKELSRPGLADVMDGLEPGFILYVRDQTWGENELEEASQEYERLFTGHEGVSPFAAHWMDGDDADIQRKLETGITNLYELLRAHPSEFGLGHVPADHIGMLLSLTSIALQADRSGDLANQAVMLYEQWAPRFCAMLLMSTKSPLYLAAARLLLDLLGRGQSAPEPTV